MRVLGLIPARKGSKGVPGKNKSIISGRPLIDYTAESALKSNVLEDIVVTSDDEDILDFYSKHPKIITVKRPSELAADNSKSIEFIIHTLKLLQNRGKSYDCVCLLQPTSPLRDNNLIYKCVKKYYENSNGYTVITVVPVPHQFNPEWTFRLSNEGYVIPNSIQGVALRRQDLPEYYIRDGAVYVINTSLILNDHSLYSERVKFVQNNRYLNIDSQEDLNLAQKYLRNA